MKNPLLPSHLLFRAVLLFLVFVTSATLAQGLFDSGQVLEIKLAGPVAALLRDRGDDPQYHYLTLSYLSKDDTVSVPVKVRVRGNFRRLKSNCSYPPLMLNFSREQTAGTLFENQNKTKLVMPCQGDRYIVREYLVYQMYNLFTPASFKARLVRVTLMDSELKGRNTEPFYGILLEEEEQMAQRNGMVTIERQLVKPEQTQPDNFLRMAVFEYLIGNTDWSVQYRQNVKLMAPDSLSRPYTIPYDFDHAGIVSSPYAKPAPELQLSSVRVRRFRGYCLSDMNHFQKTFHEFISLKDQVYKLYSDSSLLEDTYKKNTLRYLDEFYRVISDPKKAAAEFQYPCRADGTGNVVIKGLKDNR